MTPKSAATSQSKQEKHMLEFLRTLWAGMKALAGMVWTAVKAVISAVTWPARWAIAKAEASKIGLWIWSLTIDPPKMPFLYAVLFVVSLPIGGIAIDRMLLRADLAQQVNGLESRVSSLGMANLACSAERDAWKSRAVTAEDKYANLVKREPIAEVAPVIAPPPAKKKAPVRKKAVETPWYDKLLAF